MKKKNGKLSMIIVGAAALGVVFAILTFVTKVDVFLFLSMLCSVGAAVVGVIQLKQEKNLIEENKKLQKSEKSQKELFKDILAISERVKNGAQSIGDIIGQLNDATESVNSAINEIAYNTERNTAGIQEQKNMTKQIQASMNQTVDTSKKMVDIAGESIQCVEENKKVLQKLRKQSKKIISINNNVSDSMNRLQDKIKEVQTVTNLIFSVSSQTNLLALNASIGKAKEHLYQTSLQINKDFTDIGLQAYISVNKALVTQASSAIPIVPLYFMILYKIMKEKNTHEGCIEQIGRLFHEKLASSTPTVDELGRIRLDDYEMDPSVQEAVMAAWDKVNTENVKEVADLDGYWEDFYHMFGFGFDEINYDEDVDIEVSIKSIVE